MVVLIFCALAISFGVHFALTNKYPLLDFYQKGFVLIAFGFHAVFLCNYFALFSPNLIKNFLVVLLNISCWLISSWVLGFYFFAVSIYLSLAFNFLFKKIARLIFIFGVLLQVWLFFSFAAQLFRLELSPHFGPVFEKKYVINISEEVFQN